MEITYENPQVNPFGQYVYKGGDLVVVSGLNLALYKDPKGFINNISVGGLALGDFATAPLNNYWAIYAPSMNEGLLYAIGGVNASTTFAQYWTLSTAFNALVFGPVAGQPPFAICGVGIGCGSAATVYWNETKLALNNSFTGWPITFHPYVTMAYEFPSGPAGLNGNGESVQCFTCAVNAASWLIGMTPTLDLSKYWGIPVTLTAPTWFDVAQTSYWGPVSSGAVGMFTSGLTATIPLKFMPAQYGHWWVKGGFQWYDIINTQLQVDNAITGNGATSIVVGFAGIGVAF